ncbi:MAG TPA: O-antigen polymerase [Thermoanaerobaculia bacterium]|jgi:oligosaccharide repeat unit polymerase
MKPPQRDPLWRRLFRPELLFLAGTLQALTPYVIWYYNGPNPSYDYPITYIPVAFWGGGYLAFWLGAKLAGLSRPRPTTIRLAHGSSRVAWLTWVLVIGILLQCVALVRVYGGIPILRFMAGDNSLNVDDAARANSFIGQLALFLNSQLMLDGLVLLLLLTAVLTNRRYRFLLAMAIVTLMAAGVFAGKRQTVAIAITVLASGSAVYFGHPLRPIFRYLGLRRARWWARVAMIAGPVVMLAFLGWVVTLRTGAETTGGAQALSYLQLGLVNFEAQAGEVGYGPKKFYPARLFEYFIPNRMVLWAFPGFRDDMPPRAETSAPAGFYGDLHWNVGLPGALLFALIVGYIAKYFYLRASRRPWHLLVYSLMVWTLFAPYLYNHFLTANFLPFPAIGFFFLVYVAGVRSRRLLRTRPAGAATVPERQRAYATIRPRDASNHSHSRHR